MGEIIFVVCGNGDAATAGEKGAAGADAAADAGAKVERRMFQTAPFLLFLYVPRDVSTSNLTPECVTEPIVFPAAPICCSCMFVSASKGFQYLFHTAWF